MKKAITLILFLSFAQAGIAQTSLPSSGPISLSGIALVMYNLGEISYGDLTGPHSISSLNAQSHLSDKSAPYALSDWYGYGSGGGPEIYSASIQSGTWGGVRPWYPTGPFLIMYWTGASYYTVGTQLYEDFGLTNPLDAGDYQQVYNSHSQDNFIVNSSGIITYDEIISH